MHEIKVFLCVEYGMYLVVENNKFTTYMKHIYQIIYDTEFARYVENLT